MGLFGFGKKKWDEEKSNVNKAKMRELFNSVVEDGASYQIVYGFGLDVTRSTIIVASKVTYEYASIIVGYREQDMSIVFVQTTPDLDVCSEPMIFKREDIKKAKITTGMYTIYKQGGMMAGYEQFSVIEDNDENYLVYCHQKEEADKFHDFWKNKYSKKK